MGITGLYKLIHTNAPFSITETKQSDYSGKIVCFDISLFLYQFTSSIRSGSGQYFGTLVSTDSSSTSHLLGLFYRCIRFFENGIKPIFVFDGEPPEAKQDEITQRRETKEKNEQLYKEALEAEDLESAEKFAKRTVRITREQTEEAKKLTTLLGIPTITAPFEAEAQCAYLAKSGICDAVASEDSDLLPLGCPVLLKDFSNTSSNAKNNRKPVKVEIDKVLKGFKIDLEQFIDLCVLCGSDYGGKLKGSGAQTSLKIIKAFGCLDNFYSELLKAKENEKFLELHNKEKGKKLKNLTKNEKLLSKFVGNDKEAIENSLEKLKIARKQFLEPEVKKKENLGEIKWGRPDYEGLKKFLVEKGFNEDRLEKSLEKIKGIRKKGIQQKMSSFFVKKVKK